jgi:phage shock protein E
MSVRRLAAAASVALVLAGAAACGTSGDGASVTSGPTATAAPAAGAHLDASSFAAALKIPNTTIIDVRTPAEFAQGHLPGAVNIDISSPGFTAQLDGLDRSAPYAVYCRSGNRSAAALDSMSQMGFTAAYDLSGGIGDWQSAGGEVVTG